jgi:hypothetical protein
MRYTPASVKPRRMPGSRRGQPMPVGYAWSCRRPNRRHVLRATNREAAPSAERRIARAEEGAEHHRRRRRQRRLLALVADRRERTHPNQREEDAGQAGLLVYVY